MTIINRVEETLHNPALLTCQVCGVQESTEQKISWCARCKLAYYCSRECQTAGYGVHKLACLRSDILMKQTKKGKINKNMDQIIKEANGLSGIAFFEYLFHVFRLIETKKIVSDFFGHVGAEIDLGNMRFVEFVSKVRDFWEKLSFSEIKPLLQRHMCRRNVYIRCLNNLILIYEQKCLTDPSKKGGLMGFTFGESLEEIKGKWIKSMRFYFENVCMIDMGVFLGYWLIGSLRELDSLVNDFLRDLSVYDSVEIISTSNSEKQRAIFEQPGFLRILESNHTMDLSGIFKRMYDLVEEASPKKIRGRVRARKVCFVESPLVEFATSYPGLSMDVKSNFPKVEKNILSLSKSHRQQDASTGKLLLELIERIKKCADFALKRIKKGKGFLWKKSHISTGLQNVSFLANSKDKSLFNYVNSVLRSFIGFSLMRASLLESDKSPPPELGKSPSTEIYMLYQVYCCCFYDSLYRVAEVEIEKYDEIYDTSAEYIFHFMVILSSMMKLPGEKYYDLFKNWVKSKQMDCSMTEMLDEQRVQIIFEEIINPFAIVKKMVQHGDDHGHKELCDILKILYTYLVKYNIITEISSN